jgi:hypothetical protein
MLIIVRPELDQIEIHPFTDDADATSFYPHITITSNGLIRYGGHGYSHDQIETLKSALRDAVIMSSNYDVAVAEIQSRVEQE